MLIPRNSPFPAHTFHGQAMRVADIARYNADAALPVLEAASGAPGVFISAADILDARDGIRTDRPSIHLRYRNQRSPTAAARFRLN